jgi:uncharacterized protein
MTVHKKKKVIKSRILSMIICAFAVMTMISGACIREVSASSEVQYSIETSEKDYIFAYNTDNYNEIIIDDMAGLFSQDEERRLIPLMADCSWGGSVFLVTIDNNPYGDAADYAEAYYVDRIGGQSGVIFLVDMATRELKFYSDGEYKYDLSVSIMNIIGDNIYKMASNGNYYDCAEEAFIEVSDVLAGKRIAAPMKYASNACLAILLALIINYFIVRIASSMSKPSNSEIMRAINVRFSFVNPNVRKTTTTRTYSPRSSGSGGSGGGGGGGGGGHSGGHSF